MPRLPQGGRKLARMMPIGTVMLAVAGPGRAVLDVHPRGDQTALYAAHPVDLERDVPGYRTDAGQPGGVRSTT